MLEPHPPHHTPNTWRDFFLHIATIVVGLLIAVGLEQTVEFIHHRHQLHELEEQMRETLQANRALLSYDIERLAASRAYLSDLRLAVAARRAGKPLAAEPVQNDERTRGVLRLPNLAPYEAAKQNGTVSYLSGDQLRVYNRLGQQREFIGEAVQDWFHAISAFESFEERYVDSKGSLIMGGVITAPNLSTLSPAELAEYQGLIATLIKQVDVLSERFFHFDNQCRSVLDGVQSESQIIQNSSHIPQGAARTTTAPER